MPRNSHNPSIDESQKQWSAPFRRSGVNMHGQTYEDIFQPTPEPNPVPESLATAFEDVTGEQDKKTC